jgi:glycosyltransferase involved in cell wall biosynthesis
LGPEGIWETGSRLNERQPLLIDGRELTGMTTVSVIMPCYNHARFVVEAAESVLRQTQSDLELIIIDDCSSDGSWDFIHTLSKIDPRVRSLRHDRNQGPSKARNDALRIAKGEFIAFCDADDRWQPQKLAVQIEMLEKNRDYDLAYCDSSIINESGLPTGKYFSQIFVPPTPSSGWLFQELIRRNFINTQSVLVRRKCVEWAGEFDEKIGLSEDWWYWIRLSQRHRFLYSPALLGSYRVHSRSTDRVHRRGYAVNRIKIRRRILTQFPEITRRAKADLFYSMGVDLCSLRKWRMGRRMLWKTVSLALARDFSRSAKAGARLAMSSRPMRILFPGELLSSWGFG